MFCARDEIVEAIALQAAFSRFVPVLAEFTAAANMSDSVDETAVKQTQPQ